MNNFCLIKHKNNIKDINGYGSVDYNFLISQSFISCEDYVNFLNCVSVKAKDLSLYNNRIANIIDLDKTIYTIKDGISPYSPISYINLENLKVYCNYLNNPDLKTIDTYPYNIYDQTVAKEGLNYWIPSYNEWYKATYFDYIKNKYYAFPNSSDSQPNKNQILNNILSTYGLINAGLRCFTIINEENSISEYLISGGSQNRDPIHSKSGIKYFVSKDYTSSYISARICKRSNAKKYTLKLYDTFGDGWGENYIIVNDANHKPLTDKISIKHGYGPVSIELSIDDVEKNFNIQYYQNNKLSYENYYEIYDNEDNLIFASNMYETPPKNTIVPIS